LPAPLKPREHALPDPAENAPSPPSPWAWVPSLYFVQGIPYVVVMSLTVVLYKRLGVSNADIALVTSWMYLPWVLKPLWSPWVELIRTKRLWIVSLQGVLGALLLATAAAMRSAHFFGWSVLLFWLLAFCSATHDIAADGFYLLGLRPQQQAAFCGVRSTCYRLAMVTGQGLLVVLAGLLESSLGQVARAWSLSFALLGALLLGLFLYHCWVLPRPAADRAETGPSPEQPKDFFLPFTAFFRRPDIARVLLFLLFYRLAESQLVKMVSPFLLDSRAKGGLGLSTAEVGLVYGTVGVICLTAGGLLGGYVISRQGLRFWLWPMVCAIHLPDLVFVYLSQVQPSSLALVSALVGLEQFGYGFGFTAYMMFMIQSAQGPFQTAHYALCTGLMALGMMIPGMWSGALADAFGYRSFFLWVMASTLPGFGVAALVCGQPGFEKLKSMRAGK